MLNLLEIKFIEYDLDLYTAACLENISRGAKKLLLRPFNLFAYELVNKVAEKKLPVSFYAFENEIEVPSPDILKLTTADEMFDASILFVSDAKDLSSRLMEYVDIKQGVIIAPITQHYYKNKPLFLISIPKSGTHLLYELAKTLGYQPGIICPDNPSPGFWYCVEYSNSHTSAKDFFFDTVRRSPFGNRDHPLFKSPALFIYRNPLDIVISEANYYHKDGNTSFYGYLSNKSFHERLLTLIDDPWLLGSIRDRVSNYIPWLEFGNVVPVSFEEMVGPKGGGDIQELIQLIWSIQLKLHIPGVPSHFGNKIYKEDSPTFHKGQIGRYLHEFTEIAFDKFYTLPQDFMEKLGYDYEDMKKPSLLSKRVEEFRKRPLTYSESNFDNTPITVLYNFIGHNIVKFKKEFYIIPQGIGSIDLAKEKSSILKQFKTARSIDEAKQKIILSRKGIPLISLWRSLKRKIKQF